MAISEKIEQYVKSLNLPFVVSSLAEDYTKRFAEAKYDQLAKTKFFSRLKDLEKRDRFIIELGFYSFNAWAKTKINRNTPTGMFFQGIVSDFFPEMGKRLINGQNSSDPEEQEIIELVRQPGGESNYYAPKENKSAFQAAHEDLNDWLKERLERKRRQRNERNAKTNTG